MKDEIQISTDKFFYGLNEKIKFRIHTEKDISEFNFLRFGIYTLCFEDEYNFGIANLTVDLKKNEFGNYEFLIDAKILKLSILFIGKIELLKQEKWDSQFKNL